jgi:hypothetical protein
LDTSPHRPGCGVQPGKALAYDRGDGEGCGAGRVSAQATAIRGDSSNAEGRALFWTSQLLGGSRV